MMNGSPPLLGDKSVSGWLAATVRPGSSPPQGMLHPWFQPSSHPDQSDSSRASAPDTMQHVNHHSMARETFQGQRRPAVEHPGCQACRQALESGCRVAEEHEINVDQIVDNRIINKNGTLLKKC